MRMLDRKTASSQLKKAFEWTKKHPLSAVISLAIVAILAWTALQFMEWAVFKAVWTGASKDVAQNGGATWAFIINKIPLFLFGFYAPDARWRIVLCMALFAVYTVPLLLPRFRFKLQWGLILLIIVPLTVNLLVNGGLILPAKPAGDLGGLSLTIILSVLGLLLSFPVGILLALGRQSKLPVVSKLSIVYIEFFRGIPLITILFMSSVAVPFFLPPGVSLDKMVRVVLGLVLFQSAYLAEVIRGGLQSIPSGQYEAADSLGFGYGLKQLLIILPQALTQCISNIGGISISFIKDTTLVLIIGMFDLLGIVTPLANDPNWLGMEPEGLIFAGLVYWLICFGVSRITFAIEKQVTTLPANAVTIAATDTAQGEVP